MKWLVYLMLLSLPLLKAQQNPSGAAGRGANFYSIERESAIGAQLAIEFQQRNQVLDNSQVNGYLMRIGARLLRQIPDTGLTFRIAAFADGEKTGIHEARVLPGGYIYVPESLILTARDEAEFAGMLAHAVAHAANRDATRQATRATLATLATIPLIVGGLDGDRGLGSGAVLPVSFLLFQRTFELAADHLAAPMMARAGWDPEALARYIEREQPAGDPPISGVAPRLPSALPPRDERAASLRKEIANLPRRDYSVSAEFAAVQNEVRRLNADPAHSATPPTLNPPLK
ncbi:MAG TPA: M48 family metalloprotease [Bryobacteraceae bacterium]|nr:M48 family metalloprotease [Bryobacteraceae bacterium]